MTTSDAGPREKVTCRLIETENLPAVATLLCEGFPTRPRAYWTKGLARMETRPVPDGYPRYGHLLSAGDRIVGCLLLLMSTDPLDGTPRGNVSSWYTTPAYRSFAPMLASVALRRKELTLINISPAPMTWPILDAQGYKRYVSGQLVMPLALLPTGFGTRVTRVTAQNADDACLPAAERDLLKRHADYGAVCLVASVAERHQPFVFLRRRLLRGWLPGAQLVWCRDLEALPPLAGALGRALLRHGVAAVSIDAQGPVAGMRGVYRDGNGPKFYRGPRRPRHGDLADTELVIFGA